MPLVLETIPLIRAMVALLRRFLAARHEIENPKSLSNNYL